MFEISPFLQAQSQIFGRPSAHVLAVFPQTPPAFFPTIPSAVAGTSADDGGASSPTPPSSAVRQRLEWWWGGGEPYPGTLYI